MASVTQAILTVGGSTTAFLPLPSAWPSGTDCTSNLYLHTPIDGVLTFLAWDPLYGASMVLSAQSCLPPQVSNWWSQPVDESIYTALGPTFVCPEAYSAVQTAVVSSSLLQTFCCPSQYTLLVPQPNIAKAFPSQCISKAISGQIMTFLTNQKESDQSTATIVMTDSATIFAIPVNGFNFATKDTTSSKSTKAASPASTSARRSASTNAASSNIETQPASTSTGPTLRATPSSTLHSVARTAGISVGVVGAALLAAIFGFFAYRRHKKSKKCSSEDVLSPPVYTVGAPNGMQEHSYYAKSLPAREDTTAVSELESENRHFELEAQERRAR